MEIVPAAPLTNAAEGGEAANGSSGDLAQRGDVEEAEGDDTVVLALNAGPLARGLLCDVLRECNVAHGKAEGQESHLVCCQI
ncbi:hypothetical protein U1Q18_014124 [Sarracenia purpurea var. burkii]